jgi:hypothetical protein
MGIGIYKLYGFFRQQRFRDRRIRFFLDTCKPNEHTRILDVGGHAYDWQSLPIRSKVTLVNTVYPPGCQVDNERFRSEIGDGRQLDYETASFDVAYSNSVIEHVGSSEDQKKFAAEIRRVGRAVFVQTPNRWFFVEPHFLAVFIHYLPARLARPLLRVFSFRALFRRGDNVDLKALSEELRLLSYREVKALFPDCEIHREKWYGLTKSFIAVRAERGSDSQ